MKTDKESGAVRLLEALNGVSEELLERSERAGMSEKGKRNTGIRFFAHKYAKACAACLCLAVLGAAYFGISQIRMGSAGDAGTKSGGAADNYNNAGRMEEMLEEGNQVPEQADTEGTGYDGAESALAEPEWLDVDSLEEIASAAGQTNGENFNKENASPEMQGGCEPEAAPEEERALQEALTEEEPATAAVVPAGYVLIKAEGSSYYEWSDGEHNLQLKLTGTDLTADLRFDAEPPVYTVQEEWRELLPAAGENGYRQFALLYEDGVLAEYYGALERDEIILLMESLAEIHLP